MRFLLDTHIFAWVVGDPSRLSASARVVLTAPDHVLLISPASIWEMSIEHHLGKWPDVAPFMDEEQYAMFMDRLGAQELAIQASHARLAGQFNVDHADPFDRLLASQSLLEGVPLISADTAMDVFPIDRIW